MDIRVTAQEPVRIFVDDASEPVAAFAKGAAEGQEFLTLYIFNGDIANVRNIQGGNVHKPNLDIGAGASGGTSGPRGNIVLNWDVGNGTYVYNGRKRKLFSVNEVHGGVHDNRIHSYAPHRFHAGAQVWRNGRWETL